MAADKFETRMLCGRLYQAYSINNEINLEPTDEEEEDRLRIQHELLKLLLPHRQFKLLPQTSRDPTDILDCGYGTGDWAVQVAELFPDSKITGIDINPIWVEQNDRPENFVPEVSIRTVSEEGCLNHLPPRMPCCLSPGEGESGTVEDVADTFWVQKIADLNVSGESFSFAPESFDFVNSRFVAGGLSQSRWPSYVTDIRRVLKPGGAVEFMEWDLFFRADVGNGERLAALREWTEQYLIAIGKGQGNAKKSRQAPPDLEAMLQASGYVRVQSATYDVPLGRWPSTQSLRDIGEQGLIVVKGMLESKALFPIITREVMTEVEFRSLVARCIEELQHPDTHAYIRLYTCYGEKPE